MTTYAWIDESTNKIIAITKELSKIYFNHEITYELSTTIKKLLYWNGSKIVKKTQAMLDQEKQDKLEKDWKYILQNSSSFSEFKQKIGEL